MLSAFVIAAEAVGLGCCPISAVRNHAARISDLLGLADHVFPVAGLTLGWPAEEGAVSLRLPLDVTVHTDRFGEADIERKIAAYDARRAQVQPYGAASPMTTAGDGRRHGAKPRRISTQRPNGPTSAPSSAKRGSTSTKCRRLTFQRLEVR